MIRKLLGMAMGFALLGFICSTFGLDMPLVLAATHAAYINQSIPFYMIEVMLDEKRLTIG